MKKEVLVPEQHGGGKTGATARKRTRSEKQARILFQSACARLLNVNRWYEYAGEKGTQFQLTDAKGNLLNSDQAAKGNLIRIKIPAPANKDGDGFDWVIIEAIESVSHPMKHEQLFGFRVRPVDNPNNNSPESAHFYTSEATSSFLIIRSKTTVYAMERGRNEKPNVNGSLLSKVRNFFVGLGAMLGLSVPAWKLWAESMLEMENVKVEM